MSGDEKELPPAPSAGFQPVPGTHPSPPPKKISVTLRLTSKGKIVGRSAPMRDVLATIDRIARSPTTVLISGESGTGKELVVAALHDASPRRDAPLVTVNCGAIPESLLESELFGHTKGAFTGAVSTRQGRVGAAEKGTLFLDEVGELPLLLQVKLLRLLQQREYSMVGDDRVLHADIRVVAATNRNLEEEVAAGRFRQDLYYRLNVIQLDLPPLRERLEDLELLALHFLRTSAVRSGRPDICGFTEEAMTRLKAYDWPGNIRALENTIERAVLLSPGPLIRAEDLPERVRTAREPDAPVNPTQLPETGIDLRAAVEEYETNLVRQALARTGWNKTKAAQLLGMNRTTLVEMLKRKSATRRA
jgi:sigma-54 specific flagellar transcriptional regulator A